MGIAVVDYYSKESDFYMGKDQENKTEKEKKIFKGFKVPRLQVTPSKVFLYILIVVLTVKLIFDVDGFGKLLSGIGSFAISILGYLVIGAIIAYILNIYVLFLENKAIKKVKNVKVKRAVAIIIAYLTLFAIIGFLVFALIPALTNTLMVFAENIPKAFTSIKEMYIDVMKNGKFNLPAGFIESLEQNIGNLQGTLLEIFDVKVITETLTSAFASTISGVFNVVMGLMVSVYMLLEKNKALGALKRINYAIFSKKRADTIMWGAKQINAVLRSYFAGKVLQASIILISSYVLFLIAGVKYAILLAVIMAIMNMIPYIGPWIGGTIVVFVSVPQGIIPILATLICVLAVQAFDNWFVTPKIVGGKMGISPLLVLVGLCIFGGIFGLPGMIFGDVMMAIVKILFYDGFVQKKLYVKKKNGFLPQNFDEKENANIEQIEKNNDTKNIENGK